MTIEQLQKITLDSQGLLQPDSFGNGKNGVLNTLEHLGYLQIDTLSIIERAHHHTLWTRIEDYKTQYLNELVTERTIFEYWFHAASYLPMRDFRFFLPQMEAVKNNTSHYYNADPKVMQYVMDTIRAEGPKKSRDFENETKKSGIWWNWKPTKIALERLFLQGDLMISERLGMQKTFEITERFLPESIDLTMPSEYEYAAYLVKTYLRAYGFTTVKQITHLKTGASIKQNVLTVLNEMIAQKIVQKVQIERLPPVYVQQDRIENVDLKNNKNIKLLSPFDNAIIHRDRIQQVFDFDYRIECYTPKDKRQFGYFCLPILFENTFIGRVDCKAHRKEKEFEIIHLHIENENIDFETWIKPFVTQLHRFAAFNDCNTIKVTQVSPSNLKNTIQKAINNETSS